VEESKRRILKSDTKPRNEGKNGRVRKKGKGRWSLSSEGKKKTISRVKWEKMGTNDDKGQPEVGNQKKVASRESPQGNSRENGSKTKQDGGVNATNNQRAAIE